MWESGEPQGDEKGERLQAQVSLLSWSLETEGTAHSCPQAFGSSGKAQRGTVCPAEVGGHRGPGGKAASQGRGRLCGTLPFPAPESEEGTQALPVRGEGEGSKGRRKGQQKTANTPFPPPAASSHSPDANLPLRGFLLREADLHFLWPLSPPAQRQGPLGGDCMFPRMQRVSGTQASPASGCLSQPSPSQGPGFPLAIFHGGVFPPQILYYFHPRESMF